VLSHVIGKNKTRSFRAHSSLEWPISYMLGSQNISGGYKQLNPAICLRNLKFRTHVYDDVYFHYRSGDTPVPPGGWNIPKITFEWNIAKLSVQLKNIDKKLYSVQFPIKACLKMLAQVLTFIFQAEKLYRKKAICNWHFPSSAFCVTKLKFCTHIYDRM